MLVRRRLRFFLVILLGSENYWWAPQIDFQLKDHEYSSFLLKLMIN